MKYPKTMHLPYSPGLTNDDKRISTMKYLENCEVVITEKLDGENTCMERNYIHARSEHNTTHPSRNMVKALHASIKDKIPEYIAVFGENMYAKHSIAYDKLDSVFYVFAVFNKETRTFLSWDSTEYMAKHLGLKTVPVMYRGPFDGDWIGDSPKSHLSSEVAEGHVVRRADEISLDQFSQRVAKYVRSNHVQTDQHWKRNWVPNPSFKK